MKFFFPDSQDQIDPSFEFITEERSIFRVRQRDDRYAHEVLHNPPFDGLLVSKTVVDGLPGAAGKYSLAQRQRLYRTGVRDFFRLDEAPGPRLTTMGDCGAFSYVREDVPPYSPDEVIDFYTACGFDLGISVDHVILGYDPAADTNPGHPHRRIWDQRQQLTLDLASQFLARCRTGRVPFEPVGVAQGWSPASYSHAVRDLQRIGYRRIAIGGMVPLKTHEILACLDAIHDVRNDGIQLHLLGVTRCDNVDAFAHRGVTSFDSTSPFRQAFKDDRDNYYTLNGSYTAIRVPQVDGNPKLKARIVAGQVSQRAAIDMEQGTMDALRRYENGDLSTIAVLSRIRAYEQLCVTRKDRTEEYRRILEDRPWRHCPCGICEHAGIEVVLFRGAERNKRRGFHNLYVFNRRLQRELTEGTAA